LRAGVFVGRTQSHDGALGGEGLARTEDDRAASRIAKEHLSLDAVLLLDGNREPAFVKELMMGRAHEYEIIQLCLPAVEPVLDVVGIEPPMMVASWETAGSVPNTEGAANGRRDRPGFSTDIEGLTIIGRVHGDEARIAGYTAKRFRREPGSVVEFGGAGAGQVVVADVNEEGGPITSRAFRFEFTRRCCEGEIGELDEGIGPTCSGWRRRRFRGKLQWLDW